MNAYLYSLQFLGVVNIVNNFFIRVNVKFYMYSETYLIWTLTYLIWTLTHLIWTLSKTESCIYIKLKIKSPMSETFINSTWINQTTFLFWTQKLVKRRFGLDRFHSICYIQNIFVKFTQYDSVKLITIIIRVIFLCTDILLFSGLYCYYSKTYKNKLISLRCICFYWQQFLIGFM
jgi:hypothetical protein